MSLKTAMKRQQRKVRGVFDLRQPAVKNILATMGDGQGHLHVSGEEGKVWVQINNHAFKALCNRISPTYGMQVWVGIPTEGGASNLYKVLSDNITNATDPSLIQSGGYAPSSRYLYGGLDPLMIDERAITFLRIGVSETGGMMVDLNEGYIFDDTDFIAIGRQDVDISAHIPVTAGKAAMVMISIDNTGAVIQTKGAEADIADLKLPLILPAVIPYLPAVPADTKRVCGAVRVYYGQTETGEGQGNTDYLDLRFAWSGGGGGGGVASVTGDGVDNTDPLNPVISFPTVGDIGAEVAGAAATAESNAKGYADGLVVGLWDDRGNFDASVNAYPSSGGSGTAGAIKKGDIWTVSVAGTLPTGLVVEIGDTVRALVDTPGNTQANWAIAQQNIGYIAENSANKSADVETDKASTTKYPAVKALYDWAVGKFQPLTSGLSGWNSITDTWTYASATTINVPSGAASKYAIGNKIKMTNSGTKQNYIVAIADTLLTVAGDGVANSAISDKYFSMVDSPVGFPQWFPFTSTTTGFSTNPTFTMQFHVSNKICHILLNATANGISNGINQYYTLPIVCTSGLFNINGLGVDNGGLVVINAYIGAGTSTLVLFISPMNNWTPTGNKSGNCSIFYPIG